MTVTHNNTTLKLILNRYILKKKSCKKFKDSLLCFDDVDFQNISLFHSFALSTSCPKFENPTPKPTDNNEKNSPLVLTSRDINLARKFVFRDRPCRVCFTVSVPGYV